MDKEKTVKQISIRTTETMFNRITERAAEEDRTISNFIIRSINYYLDDIDEAKKRLNK